MPTIGSMPDLMVTSVQPGINLGYQAQTPNDQGDPVLGGMTDAQIQAMLYSPLNTVASINGAGSSTLPQYSKGDSNVYALPSGTFVEVTDPGVNGSGYDKNGQKLSSVGIVVGQNREGYSSSDDSVIPEGYTGYLFYTQTQRAVYQYPVNAVPGTTAGDLSAAPPPSSNSAITLAPITVTPGSSDGSLPPISLDNEVMPVNITAQPLVAPEIGDMAGPIPGASIMPSMAVPQAAPTSPRYTAANAPGSVSDTLGLSPEAMDASIQAGNTGPGAAAWYATKATFYEVWNFASMGFVKRNDARQAQWLNGQLSDSNYYKGMAIDAAGSVATAWLGGQAGGVVLGKVGGGIVGHVISGAVAGGAGDATSQTQRLTYLATQGQTGQKAYSGKNLSKQQQPGPCWAVCPEPLAM